MSDNKSKNYDKHYVCIPYTPLFVNDNHLCMILSHPNKTTTTTTTTTTNCLLFRVLP